MVDTLPARHIIQHTCKHSSVESHVIRNVQPA